MDIMQIFCIAVILIITAIFIGWKIYKNGLRGTVIDLIVKVEDTIEDNQEKFNNVVMGIIEKLPFPFNIFITTSSIEKFVQKIFDEVKVALDYTKKQ